MTSCLIWSSLIAILKVLTSNAFWWSAREYVSEGTLKSHSLVLLLKIGISKFQLVCDEGTDGHPAYRDRCENADEDALVIVRLRRKTK